MTINELREKLAERAHDSWTHWMRYLFSQCEEWESRSMAHPPPTIIPAGLVERWQRQMETPYDKLTEAEKQSDRTEADKALYLIKDLLVHLEGASTRAKVRAYVPAALACCRCGLNIPLDECCYTDDGENFICGRCTDV